MPHTPGPWKAKDTRVYMGSAGGFDIRDCPSPEDNARFIAAAPDMHEMLSEARSPYISGSREDETWCKRRDELLKD